MLFPLKQNPVHLLANDCGDLPEKENTGLSRILIIKVEGNAKIGILVDEVREVVTLSEETVEKISSENGDIKSYLTGIGKYNNTLISLLNIGSLIADIDSTNVWFIKDICKVLVFLY